MASHRCAPVVVAVALLALSGCGSPGGSEPAASKTAMQNSDSTAAPAETTRPPQSASGQQARFDLTHETQLQWTEVGGIHENAFDVHFNMNNPKCSGVRNVVEEDEHEIRVAVIEGTVPDAPKNCAAVAAVTHMRITLGQPVGHRKIVELKVPDGDLR